MKKVKVSELAKDYGMKSLEMAKLLQDLGFEHVRSHSSTLDDADLMQVEARLATAGISREKTDAASTEVAAPKKKLLPGAGTAEDSTLPARKELPKKALPKAAGKKSLVRRESLEAKATADAEPVVAAEQGQNADSLSAENGKLTAENDKAAASNAAAGPIPEVGQRTSDGTATANAEPTREVATREAAAKPPAAEVTKAKEFAAEASAAAATGAAPAAELPPAATKPAALPQPAEQSAAVLPKAVLPKAVSPKAVSSNAGSPQPAAAASKQDSAAQDSPAGDSRGGAETANLSAAAKESAAAAGQAMPQPAVQEEPAPPQVPPVAASAAAPTLPPASLPATNPAQAEPTELAAEAGASAAAPAAPPTAPVRRLLVPQKRATVVGRIELTQEMVRDAKSRSAPATPQDLRRAALQKMQQQRSGVRPPAPTSQRRGPAGPGQQGGRGGRDGGRSGPGGRKLRQPTIDPNRIVEVQEPVSIKALSEALGIKVTELIQTLFFKLKIKDKNINSMLTNEEVELVGLELERNIKIVEHKAAMDQLMEQLVEESAEVNQLPRAPVVTFMGHVDHGKTSLMDRLRRSDVAKHEAGGITQHIGAYKVHNDRGQEFVILDTPGHAAFTAMRARGADLTDIVVLVVAGDDGVMPQTEEAINHALAAKVPIIVAITKCDLPASRPEVVKQQLMIKGLQAEDYGGQTGVVAVSAVSGEGIDELIDRIQLEAEMLELKARPEAPGKGIVVESRQSPEQGVVVTLLVTDGTLRLKDQIVCGESFARVRAMIDDHGNNLTEAGPSTPITVFGLDRLPAPGDKLFVVEDAKKAKEVVEERQRRVRELSRAERSAVTLETLSAKLAERDVQEIKLILKADAMGSLEPLKKCLAELSTPEVKVNLVHSALGGINETDVSLAQASGAVIVGFNTIADSSARQEAERAGVEIRYYDVIYELLDQVRAAMEGMLAPQEVQNVIGHAEVKATFKSSKFGTIAGCRVTDGVIRRNATVRLSRDGAVVWSGKVGGLRRIDEDVREVKSGFECGVTLDGYHDIKVGDVLEFVQTDLVKRTLGG